MESERFNQVVEEQIGRSLDTLMNKAKEYATADLLHNFKVAAKLRHTTTTGVLAGRMIKHTVSIFDMCESGEEYSEAQWNEKITDHINYLLLLQAIVTEQRDDQTL